MDDLNILKSIQASTRRTHTAEERNRRPREDVHGGCRHPLHGWHQGTEPHRYCHLEDR
jgi:hypothetical protein